jgi:hypothetical protein
MSKPWGKRPSPALVISILALFVALGGSAYAASKIGTKDIKNNAITPAKIKKNAVTTAKLKDNAVTGSKINEGSLGSVPSAATATNATNAVNAENAKNWSRYATSGLKKASVGQSVTLLTVGPFTMTGKCKDLGGGNIEAATYLTTSQPGSNMYSYEDSYYENDFDPGTEAEIGESISSTTAEVGFWYSYYTNFTATSGDGATLLRGDANNSVLAFGAQCAFQVDVINNA